MHSKKPGKQVCPRICSVILVHMGPSLSSLAMLVSIMRLYRPLCGSASLKIGQLRSVSSQLICILAKGDDFVFDGTGVIAGGTIRAVLEMAVSRMY
jgi:hypothetical protein